MPNYFDLATLYAQYETAQAVILPVPFDKSCSWLKGASNAPDAILEASQQVELYDIETRTEVYRKGIFTAKPILADSSEEMVDATYQTAKKMLQDKKLVVTIGGDHSVVIGPARAYAECFTDLSILHLDAHADMRDTYEANPYSHACVVARMQEYTQDIVSVGIRSMDISEASKAQAEKIIFAQAIYDAGKEWVNPILNQLTGSVYISIDVDVFDTGLMPSTGTPEPGGLNWYQVIHLLRRVSSKKKIVGFDVVELLPNLHNKAPDFLCAKLIYKLLSYCFY